MRGYVGGNRTALENKSDLLKKYENQSKLYIDMNGTPALPYFSKPVVDYLLVIFYNHQCHIGIDVNY